MGDGGAVAPRVGVGQGRGNECDVEVVAIVALRVDGEYDRHV